MAPAFNCCYHPIQCRQRCRSTDNWHFGQTNVLSLSCRLACQKPQLVHRLDVADEAIVCPFLKGASVDAELSCCNGGLDIRHCCFLYISEKKLILFRKQKLNYVYFCTVLNVNREQFRPGVSSRTRTNTQTRLHFRWRQRLQCAHPRVVFIPRLCKNGPFRTRMRPRVDCGQRTPERRDRRHLRARLCTLSIMRPLRQGRPVRTCREPYLCHETVPLAYVRPTSRKYSDAQISTATRADRQCRRRDHGFSWRRGDRSQRELRSMDSSGPLKGDTHIPKPHGCPEAGDSLFRNRRSTHLHGLQIRASADRQVDQKMVCLASTIARVTGRAGRKTGPRKGIGAAAVCEREVGVFAAGCAGSKSAGGVCAEE